MKYFLILLITFSAFAKFDEAAKLTEDAKARREAWKVFREKVSMGNLCEPRNYQCFTDAMSKIPGNHVEDLISVKSALEPFYQRSISDKDLPCGDSCQNNMRAWNLYVLLNVVLPYKKFQESVYNYKDATTVKATRVRAYMDLSAYGNLKKHLKYMQEEFSKIEFTKVTEKFLSDKAWFDSSLNVIQSGELLSNSVLCHLHPGSLVFDEIANSKPSKVNDIYRALLKDFHESGRKACKDSTPIEYRGMDESTRNHYTRITEQKLKEMNCPAGDYACVRKNLRTFEIRYSDDVLKVSQFIISFQEKSKKADCDEACKALELLRGTQTFITYISLYDRNKLGSTMDWKKDPEARYLTIPEDVQLFEILNKIFSDVISELGKLDSAKITDPGIKSELKSIARDASDFASGKMLKDSVICTMDPWTAAYDKYMVPYKDPKQNKILEQNFLEFKEKVCK